MDTFGTEKLYFMYRPKAACIQDFHPGGGGELVHVGVHVAVWPLVKVGC